MYDVTATATTPNYSHVLSPLFEHIIDAMTMTAMLACAAKLHMRAAYTQLFISMISWCVQKTPCAHATNRALLMQCLLLDKFKDSLQQLTTSAQC
jgi:hypothetical protein